MGIYIQRTPLVESGTHFVLSMRAKKCKLGVINRIKPVNRRGLLASCRPRPYYGLVIGFNHGLMGLAENPARGTGFWSQNTEGVARGVLTEKARPEGWVFSQAQQPMIKTYYSMSLHCNSAKLLYCSQTISDSRSKERESALDTVARQNRLLLRNGCLATYIIGKLFVHSMIWHNGC